jgi:Xaa-Pro aminopeptidase
VIVPGQSVLTNIRESLKRKGLSGFLVTDIINVRYCTGFSGSSGFLFITAQENFFVTDFRYQEQSAQEVSGWEIAIEKGNRVKTIQNLYKRTGIKKLGIESSVSYSFFRKLSEAGLVLHDLEGLVEKIREIKTDTEIIVIQEAVRRAEKAFLDIKPHIREGAREQSIALRLEERLKKNGCRKAAFDIIVASGPNSALPHAKPTEKKIGPGDLVIIDWGGEADGYFSDMTRTLLVKGGEHLSKKKEIYRIVLEANIRSISSVAAGTHSKQVDTAARNYIKRSGYGDCFGHGTGHGVGLQVHEAPRITRTGNVPLRENMVFTIEPGIYVPGLGGVRIEDIVVVNRNQPTVLTTLPK